MKRLSEMSRQEITNIARILTWLEVVGFSISLISMIFNLGIDLRKNDPNLLKVLEGKKLVY